jgi:long-chain fatty acid transport protein
MLAVTVGGKSADAQGLHYRTIPIGERAIGLGGAYTGIADDPSSMYYNPAGATVGGGFQLLGSLSSFVYARQKIEDGFETDLFRESFDTTRITTLPHFVGTVVRFGKKAFGDSRYALGFSSFEVQRERFGDSATNVDAEGSSDLRINDDYRMRWWGFAFAMQATEDVSVGLSMFLSYQTYRYSSDVGLAFGGQLGPDGFRVGGDSAINTSGVGVSSWDFVFRLGALYRINPKWQLGFMFQPPGAPLGRNGSLFRRFEAASQGQSVYFLYDEGGLDGKLPIPFELRVGAELKVNSLTTLAFDFGLSGPVRSGQILNEPAELQDAVLGIGTYFANTTKRRTTPNAAVGAEHLFGKVVVAGGLFTNISAAPKVPATSTEYLPERISQFGASVAIGVDTKGYRLTVGATGYFGRGNALAFTLDREAQVLNYQRTKSNLSSLVLYIAGAVQLASKGAKQVQEKYKERKSIKKGGAEPDSPE